MNASGEKKGIQCEMGAAWSSGAPGSVLGFLLCSCHLHQEPCHDIVSHYIPGLLLLALGAAEMSSCSCRVLAMAVVEKTDQQTICEHYGQIQGVFLGQGREVRRKLGPSGFPELLLNLVAAAWSWCHPQHPQHPQEMKQPPS